MHPASPDQVAPTQNRLGPSNLSVPLARQFTSIAFACLLALTACRPSNSPKNSIHEITGTSTERIAGVSAILAKHTTLPTPVIDAHFIEEQIGDGSFGPSDFRRFYALEVSPQDLSQWTRLLTPLSKATPYVTPPSSAGTWWVSSSAFASLQFYKTDGLTATTNGWIGVSPQTGHIYIFTFTM